MMTNPYTEHSAAEMRDEQEWNTALELLNTNANNVHRIIAKFCGIYLTSKEEFEESCCDPTVGYRYEILFEQGTRLNNSWVDVEFLKRAYMYLNGSNKLRFNNLFYSAEKRFSVENWVPSCKYEKAMALAFLKLIQENPKND